MIPYYKPHPGPRLGFKVIKAMMKATTNSFINLISRMMTFWMMSSSPLKIMIIFKKRGTDNFKIIKRNRKYYRNPFRAERVVWGKWKMNHL